MAGKVTAAEGSSSTMSPIGAMDIARNSDKISSARRPSASALAEGRTPAKKDEKLPWRGRASGSRRRRPSLARAMDRCGREKRVVLWRDADAGRALPVRDEEAMQP